MKTRFTLAVLFLVTAGITPGTYAAESDQTSDEPYSDDAGWEITFTPYAWIADIKAESKIGRATASLELSFSDIIDNFDIMAFSGRIEAWKGDWGIFLDGAYIGLEADFTIATPAPTIGIGVDFVDAMVDFGLGYRLLKLPLAEDQSRMLTGDILGGGRYHYLKQEIELSAVHPVLGPLGRTLGGDEEWVEMIVGARIKFDVFENLAVGVRGDIGGFGIGSGSDLTWNVVAGIDWQFRKNMSLKIGYRYMEMDYEQHSGSERFGLDAQMKGPIIGLTIMF